MLAYLTDHKPAVRQFYDKRNRPLTGCTVIHTAESVMDTLGPDTGAEAVAEFIANRTTAGSYHHIVDSDSMVLVVPLECGAFHDGTGSNNWALSLSFACRTTDWARMTPERRAGFLRQGALAFAAQQAWRKAHGYPLTELRLITKAQSDAGMSGFTYHGLRDPGRRSDPGIHGEFPLTEFLDYCRAAMAGQLDPQETDDMYDATAHKIVTGKLDELIRLVGILLGWPGATNAAEVAAGNIPADTQELRRMFGVLLGWNAPATDNEREALAKLYGADQVPDVDEAAIVAGLAPMLLARSEAIPAEDIERLLDGFRAELDRRALAGVTPAAQ